MLFNKSNEKRAKIHFSISDVGTPPTPLPPRCTHFFECPFTYVSLVQGGATKFCIQYLGILRRSLDFLFQNHLKSRVRPGVRFIVFAVCDFPLALGRFDNR